MRYVKVLLVLAAVCAYPAVALAHKKPSKRQQTALIKAFNKAVKPPTPIPAKCLREEVSTANTSWAWVEFGFDHQGRLPAVCAKFAADGKVIFHFRAGKWRWVTSGSDFRNPNGGCSLNGKLPHKVISDLDLC
ncbi:MAG TPA: hypothetical protein VMF14_04065 [Solirubrobacteraceae bacterium]|nr:hypothetical protein [Solirubrobacteraceae bacterium]